MFGLKFELIGSILVMSGCMLSETFAAAVVAGAAGAGLACAVIIFGRDYRSPIP